MDWWNTRQLLFAAATVLGGVLAITAASPTQAAPGMLNPTDLGTPVHVQPGKVTITLSVPAYREGDVIRAMIANGSPQTIFADDEKTDCSIAILDRWERNGWHAILGCMMGRAPMVVAIGRGMGRTVIINPRSVHLLNGAPPGASKGALRAGTYRITFRYRTAAGPEAEEPFSVQSQTFGIRP